MCCFCVGGSGLALGVCVWGVSPVSQVCPLVAPCGPWGVPLSGRQPFSGVLSLGVSPPPPGAAPLSLSTLALRGPPQRPLAVDPRRGSWPPRSLATATLLSVTTGGVLRAEPGTGTPCSWGVCLLPPPAPSPLLPRLGLRYPSPPGHWLSPGKQDLSTSEGPNYLTACAGPVSPPPPPRNPREPPTPGHLCAVCGLPPTTPCVSCGARYCCVRCLGTHQETR
uniref:HIT-type domain-containing protein n=1 Tax=Chelonoidis abingdonii TaxID=106734 RepID=A0A8C0GY65_CHEAB